MDGNSLFLKVFFYFGWRAIQGIFFKLRSMYIINYLYFMPHAICQVLINLHANVNLTIFYVLNLLSYFPLFQLVFFYQIRHFTLLSFGNYVYPIWTNIVGIGYNILPILCIVAIMMRDVLKSKGSAVKVRLTTALKDLTRLQKFSCCRIDQ